MSLTVEQIIAYSEEFLDYNPSTGVLIWKKSPSRNVKIGQLAGYRNKDSVLMVKIRGILSQAHRVIWIMSYKEEPPQQIDHKDRDPSNNRLDNLRASDKFTNQQNTIAHKDSSLKLKGVDKSGSKFRARASLSGQRVCLGTFETPEEAASVVRRYRIKEYGEFANG